MQEIWVKQFLPPALNAWAKGKKIAESGHTASYPELNQANNQVSEINK